MQRCKRSGSAFKIDRAGTTATASDGAGKEFMAGRNVQTAAVKAAKPQAGKDAVVSPAKAGKQQVAPPRLPVPGSRYRGALKIRYRTEGGQKVMLISLDGGAHWYRCQIETQTDKVSIGQLWRQAVDDSWSSTGKDRRIKYETIESKFDGGRHKFIRIGGRDSNWYEVKDQTTPTTVSIEVLGIADELYPDGGWRAKSNRSTIGPASD